MFIAGERKKNRVIKNQFLAQNVGIYFVLFPVVFNHKSRKVFFEIPEFRKRQKPIIIGLTYKKVYDCYGHFFLGLNSDAIIIRSGYGRKWGRVRDILTLVLHTYIFYTLKEQVENE